MDTHLNQLLHTQGQSCSSWEIKVRMKSSRGCHAQCWQTLPAETHAGRIMFFFFLPVNMKTDTTVQRIAEWMHSKFQFNIWQMSST